MEFYSLKDILDNLSELLLKYTNQFIHKGIIRDEKLSMNQIGIEIERFKILDEFVKNILKLLALRENDKLIFEPYFLIIKTSLWNSTISNASEILIDNSILSIVLNFQKHFKCLFIISFVEKNIQFNIYPYIEIHKIYYSINNLRDLKEIESFANENGIEILRNSDEKEIIEKNPHLVKFLNWNNFLYKDILFYSRSYCSDSWEWSNNNDKYKIIKDKFENLRQIDFRRFPIKVDSLKFEELDEWKKYVIEDYSYCWKLDCYASDYYRQHYDSFDYNKYAEDSTYEALGIEPPEEY